MGQISIRGQPGFMKSHREYRFLQRLIHALGRTLISQSFRGSPNECKVGQAGVSGALNGLKSSFPLFCQPLSLSADITGFTVTVADSLEMCRDTD
jgi:hypothetical protein